MAAPVIRSAWAWVLGALIIGLAAGALIMRHEDRSAARAVTEQAARQAAAYDSALAATGIREAVTRGTIASLRAAGDVAAEAAQEARARTQEALNRIDTLPRPADVDSTNPAWHRIVVAQQAVITGQAEQIVELTAQVTALDASYRADSARADAWEALARAGKITIDSLAHEVHVAAVGSNQCRLLFWDCPSRKLIALTALGTGAIIGAKYLSQGK